MFFKSVKVELIKINKNTMKRILLIIMFFLILINCNENINSTELEFEKIFQTKNGKDSFFYFTKSDYTYKSFSLYRLASIHKYFFYSENLFYYDNKNVFVNTCDTKTFDTIINFSKRFIFQNNCLTEIEQNFYSELYNDTIYRVRITKFQNNFDVVFLIGINTGILGSYILNETFPLFNPNHIKYIKMN
jgi:hypothetical protein